jgi:hypothetical protein
MFGEKYKLWEEATQNTWVYIKNIILEWILGKEIGKAWIGYIWL